MKMVSNIFKYVNVYFIADEDELEEVPASDFIFFYGFYSIALVVGIVFLVNLFFN